MVVNPKLRQWLLTVSLVALVVSTLLVILNRKHELNIDLAVVHDTSNTVVSTPLSKATNEVDEKQDVIASTPSEHDQLIISDTLDGTSIDGSLKADGAGNLILDIDVRDFFDYFLSTADDVGPAQAIAEIQRYAQQYLPQPANTQALELLSNYLRYKQTEFQLQQTPITHQVLADADALAVLRTSFDQLKLKRKSLFSAEQDAALFALEDSYASYTLSSLEIMADETTNDEQKKSKLNLLESQLPPELSASFSQTEHHREQQRNIEAAVNSPADDVQVYEELDKQGLDKQQINAIVRRRQEQRDFNLTYERYQTARQNLDKRAVHYDQQLGDLQSRFFLSPESLTQAKLRDLSQD